MNDPSDVPTKKKGMSTTTIVLIAVGVLSAAVLGTCAAGAVWVGHKAKEVKQNIADGGLVLVAPAEVVAELAGPKKDYVGPWVSASGKSTLDILADGTLKLVQDENGGKEELTAPIAAFVGNDMELRLGLTFKIAVSQPPHRKGERFEMVARGITFHRD